MKTLVTIVMTLLVSSNQNALGKVSSEFIAKLVPIAKEEGKKYGIPPSAIVSQAILESNYGRSKLAIAANNYFGIKAFHWNGDTYLYQAHDGIGVYRKYASLKESVRDYCKFVRQPRYSRAFVSYSGAEFVKSIASLGYCSDKNYSGAIASIIKKYQLHVLDVNL